MNTKVDKIAVITKSKQLFNGLLSFIEREHRVKLHFVNRMEAAKGMRFCKYIELNDSYNIKDIEEIREYVSVSIRRRYG